MIIWIHNTFECWDVHLIVIQASLLLPANEVAERYCYHRCLSFCSGGPLPMMHWDMGTPLPSPRHGTWVPTPSLLPRRCDLRTYLLPFTQEMGPGYLLSRPCYWHLLVITGDMGPTPLLLTSGGHHWRPVQTCSLKDLPPPVRTPSGGHRSGWYASYLNAYLLHNTN